MGCISWLYPDACPCVDCSDWRNEFGESFEHLFLVGKESEAFWRDGGYLDTEWDALEKFEAAEAIERTPGFWRDEDHTD
jgi:hypothetical protein